MPLHPIFLEDLETGDIITARVNRLGLINHVGYIIKDGCNTYVLHNTPDSRNQHGGNIIKEPLHEFCRSRTPLYIERTGMSAEEIEHYAHQKRHITFDTIKHNCEHFVYGLRDKVENSPQLQSWLVLAAIFMVLILIEEDE